jgi:hypothetical protein
MKIRPVGAELSHADGQMDEQTADMMKLTVDCCNFENANKNVRKRH